MDLTKTAEPRSDQQNFDDYISGPKTVTVAEVKKGTPEQPVEVHLVEFPGRPFKPSKSMRRVLIAAWGAESAKYAGRRLTLFGDPTVTFGKDAVGGVRIAEMSHIAGEMTISLTVTRGRRAPFVVRPIAADVQHHVTALTAADSIDALHAEWLDAATFGVTSVTAVVEAKDARKRALSDPEVVTEDSPDEATPYLREDAKAAGVIS